MGVEVELPVSAPGARADLADERYTAEAAARCRRLGEVDQGGPGRSVALVAEREVVGKRTVHAIAADHASFPEAWPRA